MNITLRRPANHWVVVAPIAYFTGAAVSLALGYAALEAGATSQQLVSLLTALLIIAIFLAGAGQLMRAAAHGATSRGGKLVDGWGKVTGLFGWSLGLVAAVFFPMEGTETPEWVLAFASVAVVTVPIVAFLAATLTRKRVVDVARIPK